MEELREWVETLQDFLRIQREVNKVLREQNELLYQTCERQDNENNILRAQTELLKEGISLLKERIAQYESGVVHSHRLRQN